jgi:YCII-related domain
MHGGANGPFAEGKEHIGGLWVIRAPDLDAALEWGRKATRACRVPIELGRLLAQLMPEEPEVMGLLALMLLTESRRSRPPRTGIRSWRCTTSSWSSRPARWSRPRRGRQVSRSSS